MKLNGLMKAVSVKFGRLGLKAKKHSPEILLVVGIASGVVTTVTACRATLKLNDILSDSKDTVEKIHETAETRADVYSSKDAKKDLSLTYIQTGLKVFKLYAPSIAFGALSVTSILASHNIIKSRNVALATAYATVDTAFKDYRERVVERYGEAVDKELRYGTKTKNITETTTDPETGKEKKEKKSISVTSEVDGYARYFDDTCKGYEPDMSFNLTFLKLQQSYFNDLLIARGHVFLNDVYDALGIKRTKMGQQVGWVYKNPNEGCSDGYIDFGITETTREVADNVYERAILLDFNVDGSIMDLI